jgi:hypothetical protein
VIHNDDVVSIRFTLAPPDGTLIGPSHLDRHVDITQREHRRREVFEALEGRAPSIRGELADAKSAVTDLDQPQEQCEGIAEEIAALRDRKDTVIADLVDSFESSITTAFDVFDPSFESARLVDTDDGFELIIARDGREVGVDTRVKERSNDSGLSPWPAN